MELIDVLTEGLSESRTKRRPAGIEVRQRLAPPFGQLTMPPVYGKGELEIHPRRIDGKVIEVTELDSVGSSANRLEETLLSEHRDGRYGLPVTGTTIEASGQTFTITSLEAPHRVFDAWLRLSEVPDTGETFENSSLGRELSLAPPHALDPILEASSHDLVFGTWDSHRSGPSGQVRVARSFTSTVLGLSPTRVETRAARRDPLNIGEEKDIKVSKGPKLSVQGLSSIPPMARRPGVSIEEALFIGFLSFASLRRLRFARYDDASARILLAALVLHALSLRVEEGWSLRSECELIPVDDLAVSALRAGKAECEPVTLTPEDTAAALAQARSTLDLADRGARLVGGDKLTVLVQNAIARDQSGG